MKDDLEKEDGKTIKEILNKNTIKLKKDTNLQDKEIEEIKKLFLTLGQSDIESQQRLIDLTCENLKKLTSDSKEEILKKGSLYKKLITFIGICIALILKVAGVGILISVLNMILEKVDRKDWATLTTLVGVVIVLGLVITEINDLFNTVRTMFQLY